MGSPRDDHKITYREGCMQMDQGGRLRMGLNRKLPFKKSLRTTILYTYKGKKVNTTIFSRKKNVSGEKEC